MTRVIQRIGAVPITTPAQSEPEPDDYGSNARLSASSASHNPHAQPNCLPVAHTATTTAWLSLDGSATLSERAEPAEIGIH